MGLLTEMDLRFKLKDEDLDALEEYRVEAGTIVTPSAKAFLSDHRITLVVGEKKDMTIEKGGEQRSPLRDARFDPDGADKKEGNLPAFVPPKRYETVTGAYYDEKPEHMTSIRGPKLVNKDHPVIYFRGKMDSFEARILEVQVAFLRLGMPKVAEDLGSVLDFTREILRCEVLGYDLEEQPLLGMSFDEIRARSHTPQKYYGINHFAAGLEHGEGVILLNTLRTQVREVELAAYDAFKDEYGVPERTDLLCALNRLSSLFYVMMFRILAKEYV